MTIDQWINERPDQLLATLIRFDPDQDSPEIAGLEAEVRDYLTADAEPNLMLAAIGYPAPGDTDRILKSATHLNTLRRLWFRNPPDAALLERAAADPEVHWLLTASGILSAHDIASEGSPAVHLGSRQRSSYSLAAADDHAHRHVQTWDGGQLVREALSDGTVGVTVEVELTAEAAWLRPAAESLVVRVIAAGEAADGWRLLLILRPAIVTAEEPPTRLVGQAVVRYPNALGPVTVSNPLPVAELSEADLAAVPDSVTAARSEWNTEWRRAAHQSGKSSRLYQLVLLGTRQG